MISILKLVGSQAIKEIAQKGVKEMRTGLMYFRGKVHFVSVKEVNCGWNP
jgi:hypothetical protein